jgi:hypothetical protein
LSVVAAENVLAADGAIVLRFEVLLDTLIVKLVKTRKHTEGFAILVLAEANDAFFVRASVITFAAPTTAAGCALIRSLAVAARKVHVGGSRLLLLRLSERSWDVLQRSEPFHSPPPHEPVPAHHAHHVCKRVNMCPMRSVMSMHPVQHCEVVILISEWASATAVAAAATATVPATELNSTAAKTTRPAIHC